MSGAETILLIDDDPEVLWATERILAGAGYRVITGTRASEVAALARINRPALVLLDVVLADGDGVEIAQQMKADQELKDIFVVLLSGSRTSSQEQAKGLSEGLADGYISRPVSKAELLARIDAFLRIRTAQEALRKSEERLRAVTQTAYDAIVSTDGAGNIMGWNRGAEKLFGYSEPEITGQQVTVLIPSRYHDGHAAGMARMRAGGEPHVLGKTVEMEGRRKDGGEFPLEFSLAEWQVAEGRFYTAIVRDITDRKRAEAELRLAELEREKARGSALVAQLLQGLAHEVRNPLFAINVNTAVLEKKSAAVPDVALYVGFVKEHVGRLDSLMQDLLELGRQPSAEEMIDCRLRDLVDETVLAAVTKTPEISGRVIVEAPDLPFTVHVVPNRLRRVLAQVIENALQNSPAESRVTVRVGIAAGRAFVEVSDEGSGLPEKIRGRLFEPFVTTHTGRRGLGLALAKHYVESMGGTLEAADNGPGPGATFTVRLPLA